MGSAKGVLEGPGMQKSEGRDEGGKACGVSEVYLGLLWEGTWSPGLTGE